MVYQIGIEVTIGSNLYNMQVQQLRVQRGVLPIVNKAAVLFPSDTDLRAAVGDDVAIELTGGDISETVFTGTVWSIENNFYTTTVVVTDSSSVLSGYRPADTYEKLSTGDIIQTLASDSGTLVDTIQSGLELALYVAHQSRTALEHIALLASYSDCFASITADNKLLVTSWPDKPAQISLQYGRDLLRCKTSQRQSCLSPITAIGNGPAGSVSAAEALLHTPEILPSDAANPGKDTLWYPMAMLRTPKAATDTANALNDDKNRNRSRIDAVCILSPQFDIGTVLGVTEVPHTAHDGPWIITSVIHEIIQQKTAQTSIHGISASVGGSSGGLLS